MLIFIDKCGVEQARCLLICLVQVCDVSCSILTMRVYRCILGLDLDNLCFCVADRNIMVKVYVDKEILFFSDYMYKFRKTGSIIEFTVLRA